MDTKGGKPWGGGCGGVMNWAIGFDMYTLICMGLMTNKNLLYKKINKIKFKEKTKEILNKILTNQIKCIQIIIVHENWNLLEVSKSGPIFKTKSV